MSTTSARECAFITESVAQTQGAGARLARMLRGGEMVALVGELGAGKTEFVRGMVAGMGGADAVASPTFVIATRYGTQPAVWHLDAYRLTGAEELFDAGAGDYFDGGDIVVVEWADRVPGFGPTERVTVTLEHAGPERRRITACAHNLPHVDLSGLPPRSE